LPPGASANAERADARFLLNHTGDGSDAERNAVVDRFDHCGGRSGGDSIGATARRRRRTESRADAAFTPGE